MSLQGTTPDTASSILFTDWRMRQLMPEEKIRRSFTQIPPDYRYVDAFATLCSFIPQCESAAAAAVEIGAKSNRLYIATSTPVTPSLREVLPIWIRLIQQLPVIVSPSALVDYADHKITESPYNAAPPPIQNFIAEVYRECQEKLLKQSAQAKAILEYLGKTSDGELKCLFDINQRPSLVEGLQVLIDVAKNPASTSSVKEALRLHHAVQTVAQFKKDFLGVDLLHIAGCLSEAIEFLVKFAISEHNKEMLNLLGEVVWIDTAASGDIIVTINKEELSTMTSDGRKPMELELPKQLAAPPESMSKIEGSPDHFKGTGAVHCESALLQYIVDNHLSVDPYIGASHPLCYPCRMFVDALNSRLEKKFLFGRGCDMVDPTWICPETDRVVYKKLAFDLGKDLRALSTKLRLDRARYKPLVNDDVF